MAVDRWVASRANLPVYDVPELGKDISHTTRRPRRAGSGSGRDVRLILPREQFGNNEEEEYDDDDDDDDDNDELG